MSKTGSEKTASGNPGSVVRGDRKGESSLHFDDHRDAYRRHYDDEYAQAEGDFTTYEPAYRHGHRFGTDERYRGKEYVDVEPELRSSYEERHGDGTFAGVKGAVRHAFNYSQGGSERPGPASHRR